MTDDGRNSAAAPSHVGAFRALLTAEGQRLLDRIPAYDESAALAVGERLRHAGFDPGLVATALTQARLRARARSKFGAAAERLYFTGDGLEQATRPIVAERHARRYAAAPCAAVADLCCGIGTETAALATVGLHVVGIDRDPLTCAVAQANIEVFTLDERATVRCGDVAAPDLDLSWADGVFIDPARRGGRGRTFDPRAYSPPYDVVLELADRVPATGAKLAPGIPHAVLPDGAEAEWVSVDGSVVECALWFGPLSSGAVRRATLLPLGATLTGDGVARAQAGPVQRFLYEPDGAVIRAGLVAQVAELVGGHLIDDSIAYVTSDEAVDTPFCVGYEITDVLPFQLKRLRALLRARSIGRLTVKKRGSAVEPETLRRQLRLEGDAETTIVLTRVRGEPHVLVVEPLPRPLTVDQVSTSSR